MKYSENRIRKVIKKILLENYTNSEKSKFFESSINDKIKIMLKKLEETQNKVVIEDNGYFVNIKYEFHDEFKSLIRKNLHTYNPSLEKTQIEKIPYEKDGKQHLYGSIEVYEFNTGRNQRNSRQKALGKEIKSGVVSNKSIKKRPWHVLGTNQTTKGFGPLLYEIAIEYVSRFKKCPLISDVSVSNDAKKVWKYYMDKREDVIKYQYDLVDDEEKSISSHFGYNQITPEDDTDDAWLGVLLSYNYDEIEEDKWVDLPLSKGYFKKRTPVISYMLVNNLLKISKG